MATDTTGSSDPLAFLPFTKWFCENFFKHRFNTTQFFAPHGINLASGYESPLLMTVGCVGYPLGPFFMFNLIVIMQTLLIFITSYLIARKFIKNVYLQISFIFLYSFSTFFLARATAHFNILSTIWGMSLVFYFFYDLAFSKVKKVIIAFIFLAVVFLSSWQNIPNLFLLVLILLLAKRRLALKYWRNIIVGCLAFFLFMAPFAFPIVMATVRTGQPASKIGIDIWNADVFSYLIPWRKNVFFPPFEPFFNTINFARGNQAFLELFNSIDLVIFFIFIKKFFIERKKNNLPAAIKILLIIYFFLPLGSYLSFIGIKLIDLPYYKVLSSFIPFSITRTPARMGIVLTFLITLFTLKSLDNQKHKLKKMLMIYSILITTIFSRNLTFPHFDYKKILPQKGLEIIRKDKTDNIVLNIPLTITDPSQNFLQLYHDKKIFTGYVAYTAITQEVLQYIASQPILSHLGCAFDEYSFNTKNGQKFIKDNFFIKSLRQSNVRYIIVNKQILASNACADLRFFIESDLQSFKNLRLLEENNFFKIYMIEDGAVIS